MLDSASLKKIIVPFAEVFAKVITFANIILIMTVLSKNDYADYSFIVSIIIWASVVMDGGISNLIFNESLRDELKNINLFFTARFFLAGIIIVGIALLFATTRPLLTTSGILYSIIILISSSSNIVKMIARGLGARKVDVTIILTEPLLRLALVVIVYFSFPDFHWTLFRFLLIYLLASIVTLVLGYNYLKPIFSLKIHIDKISVIKKNLVKAFNASKHYLFYYFVYIGLSRIDIIMIESNLEKNQLADFSSAYQMFTVALLFFTAINTSQFKNIIENQAKYLKYLLLVLVGVAIFFYFSSGFVIELLLPDKYYPASYVLERIMIAIIPSVLSVFFILKNNYYHRSKVNFIILLIPFFTKLTFYFTLKPNHLIQYANIFVLCEFLLLLSFVIYELFKKKETTKINE